MEIDIDKLHRVIEGYDFGRGSGATVSMLIQALQSADVNAYAGPGIFVVIAPNHLFADVMLQRAAGLVQDMGLVASVEKNNRRIIFHGVGINEVWFVPANLLKHKLTGVKTITNYFIDNSMGSHLMEYQHALLETKLERE